MCNGHKNCDDGSDEDEELCHPDASVKSLGVTVTTCKEATDLKNVERFLPLAGAFWEFTDEYDCYGEDLGRVQVSPWGASGSADGRRICAERCKDAPRCTAFNYPQPGDGHCYLKRTYKSQLADKVCEGGNVAKDWDFYTLLHRDCHKAKEETMSRGHLDWEKVNGLWTQKSNPGKHTYKICWGILTIDGHDHKPIALHSKSWHGFGATTQQGEELRHLRGRLSKNEKHLVFAKTGVWKRFGDQDSVCAASSFDGAWTDEDVPLSKIYYIHGAHLRVGEETQVVDLKDGGRINAAFHGADFEGQLHDVNGIPGDGSSKDAGSKILWSGGDAWIRLDDVHKYDGYWTDLDEAKHVYSIDGTSVTIDGGEAHQLPTKDLVPASLSADGDKLTLQSGATLIRYKVSGFDGDWTDKDEPGKNIYTISGDRLDLANTPHKLLPVAVGRVAVSDADLDDSAELETADGQRSQANEERGSQITWDKGQEWVRLEDAGIFDGVWTHKDSPGEHIYIVKGESILKDGTESLKLTIESGPRMVMPYEGITITGSLQPGGDEISFESSPLVPSITLIRYKGTAIFEGQWTEKDHPGKQVYVIDGAKLKAGEDEERVQVLAKDRLSTVLEGADHKAQLLSAAGQALTSLPQSNAIKDLDPALRAEFDGCQLVFDDSRVWIRLQDVSTFDGLWTEMQDPGKNIYSIEGDSLELNGAAPVKLSLEGEDRFVATLDGAQVHGTKAPNGGKIALSNQRTLVPFEGKLIFDGLWTPADHPGKAVYSIDGDKLQVDGAVQSIDVPAGSKFSATLGGKEVEATLLDVNGKPAQLKASGKTLSFSDGDVWMRVEDVSTFDGLWTDGQHIYDIEGTGIIVDGAKKETLSLSGEDSFSAMNSECVLSGKGKGDKIIASSGASTSTWVRATASAFDGLWTEKSHPGRKVYSIAHDTLEVDGQKHAIKLNKVLGFSTGFGGAGTQAELTGADGKLLRAGQEPGCKVVFDDGLELVRVKDMTTFDGHWTDEAKPGEHIWTTQGDKIVEDGSASSQQLAVKGERSFSAPFLGKVEQGALSADSQRITLSSGVALVRYVALGVFDGLWTEKEHPGKRAFSIEGGKLTTEASSEAKAMKFVAKDAFEVVRDSEPLHAKLELPAGFEAGSLLPTPAKSGSELKWSDGATWILMQDVDNFDGIWTEKDDPGMHITTIKGTKVSWDDGSKTAELRPKSQDSFELLMSGQQMLGTLSPDGGVLALNADGSAKGGKELVRYEATSDFDGDWIEKEHPDGTVYHIAGDELTTGGGQAQKMRPLEKGARSAVLGGSSSKGQLLTSDGEPVPPGAGLGAGGLGRQVVWDNGQTWVDVRDYLSKFDGVWTPEQLPGLQLYTIERGTITLNDGFTKAAMLPAGKDAFSTVLHALPVTGTLSAAPDKIALSSGVALIRYEKPAAPARSGGAGGGGGSGGGGGGSTEGGGEGGSSGGGGGSSGGGGGSSGGGGGSTGGGGRSTGGGGGSTGGGGGGSTGGGGGRSTGGGGGGSTGGGGGGGSTGGGGGGGSTGGGGGGSEGGGGSSDGIGGGSSTSAAPTSGGGGAASGERGSRSDTSGANLDGAWTRQDRPGEQVYNIEDGEIDWDGHSVTPITLGTGGHFTTKADDSLLEATLTEDGERIKWDFGHTWVRWPLTVTEAPVSTTEGAYCFADHIVYVPMNMAGTNFTQESDAFACQARCRRTKGCDHFAFWNLGGTCHLQDGFALKTEYRIGYTSGPFSCWGQLANPKSFSMHGDRTYLPRQISCFVRGATYVPALAEYTTSMSGKEYGNATMALLACQKYCYDLAVCGYFYMTFPERICSIAPPTAELVEPILKAMGGPRECKKKDVVVPGKNSKTSEVVIRIGEKEPSKQKKPQESGAPLLVRKFREGPMPGIPGARYGWSAVLAATLGGAILLAAGLLVRSRVSWRSEQRRAVVAHHRDMVAHLVSTDDPYEPSWEQQLATLE